MKYANRSLLNRSLFRLLVISVLWLMLIAMPGFAMDYAAVYEKTSKSVVYIASFIDESAGRQGAGFFVNKEGLILTSRHVVWDEKKNSPAGRILVFVKPEKLTGRSQDDLTRRYDALIVAEDKTLDLALLKLTTKLDKPVEPLVFAPDDAIKTGLSTAAVGHPAGGARWSLTTGRISGMMADFGGVKGRDMIQMETSLNPGNSGGPLLNSGAQVLGVNSAIRRKGPNGELLQGLNFAVVASRVRLWTMKKVPDSGVVVSKVTVSLKPVSAKSKAESAKVSSGKVMTPAQIEAMVESEAEEIIDEFKEKRKQMDRRFGF